MQDERTVVTNDGKVKTLEYGLPCPLMASVAHPSFCGPPPMPQGAAGDGGLDPPFCRKQRA